MKKILSIMLSFVLALAVLPAFAEEYTKHSSQIWGTFDTLITLIAYTRTDEEFQAASDYVQGEMTRLHQIFDQYHTYEGVKNLCAVNKAAAEGPVEAEPELIDLLMKIDDWRQTYSDLNNPAMGAVLELWHNAREDGTYVPDPADLATVGEHCDWNQVLIDPAANTVAFADPLMRLDLGAAAKGYSAQIAADGLREMGIISFIVNAGGNVVCGDAPLDGRENWTVGVEGTDGVSVKLKLAAKNVSIVTSGDYQRYYTVDGVNYHHLIDPRTLQPGRYLRAVTVICDDSGLGDFLSTALFLMPMEDGLKLAEKISGSRVCWTLLDEQIYYTDAFSEMIVP